MNDAEAIAFFVRQAGELARSEMSLRTARPFLRGALLLAGEHDAVEALRTAYEALCVGDQQLELIAGGQLRLPLDGNHSEGRGS